jgi:hypothetical protein
MVIRSFVIGHGSPGPVRGFHFSQNACTDGGVRLLDQRDDYSMGHRRLSLQCSPAVLIPHLFRVARQPELNELIN